MRVRFTDRILFQAYPTDIPCMLYIHKYNEIDYIRDSDHSPVYGAVTLRIGPNSNKGHIFKKVPIAVRVESRSSPRCRATTCWRR